MPELIRQIKKTWPGSLVVLAALVLCLVILVAVLVHALHSQPAEPSPSLEQNPPSPTESPTPAVPLLLVTAEQIAQLSYTDSVLGPMTWELSEESLLELNRVLVKYDIVSPEEICQFLAQVTVETGAGRQLTELGDEAYFRAGGYTTGTRGAGYLHLTYEYGQMAFATWMMKRYVPGLEDIAYVNPSNNGPDTVAQSYYSALQTAANLGLNVSRYSRIVYDPHSALTTGADYIADAFAWESAAYYWHIAGVGDLLSSPSGQIAVDSVSALIGGGGWQSRREAYDAFRPVLVDP